MNKNKKKGTMRLMIFLLLLAIYLWFTVGGGKFLKRR